MHALLQRLRLSLRTEVIFALLMMAATSLGFVKVLALAWVLSAVDFGFYISALGIATFLGILLSFGRVEATTKIYPILVLRGDSDGLAFHLKAVIRVLMLRGLVAVIAVSAGVLLFSVEDLWGFGLLDFVLIFGLGVILSQLALLASIVRGLGDMRLLQFFTVARGMAILTATLPAAFLSSWRGVLLIEAIAIAGVCVVFGLLAFRRITALVRDLEPKDGVDHQPVNRGRAEAGGKVIFLANLVAATIPYGGRLLVLAIAGPVVAGAFGLITTFIQIGQMLAGALAQKLGPSLIKVLHAEQSRSAVVQLLIAPIFLMISLSIIALIGLPTSYFIPVFRDFWIGYGITPAVLVWVAMHLFLPSYLFVRFVLIAIDREVDLLWASLLSSFIFFAGLGLSSLFSLGLLGYVISIFSADFVRLLYKGVAVLRHQQDL